MNDSDSGEHGPRLPKLTVVVVTYMRAADMPRCLDSLVSQTFKDFEVLVCDDGSTDTTGEVVARYRDKLDLTYHWAPNFGGPARPRNIGLERARGEYVAFVDSDDWWTEDKLARSLECLEAGADVVYHDLYFATRATQKVFLRKSPSRALTRPVFEDLLINGNGLNCSSVVVRRGLLRSIGGFCEEPGLMAAEDYDAWLRLAQVTEAFVRVPRTLGFYWAGGGNLSNPRRALINLDALELRYGPQLQAARARGEPYWMPYERVRAHLRAGAHDQARHWLQQTRWDNAPALMRLKCLWMRLLSIRA